MNILKDITKLVYKYGDEADNYRFLISSIYVNYGLTDANIIIEDKIPKIIFPLGYKYKVSSLTNCEQYSIWEGIMKMLNKC